MNVLLIGGTGVLSTDIMNLCINKNLNVYVLIRGNQKNLLNRKANLIQADISDSSVIKKKIKNLYFDVVIDFISYNKKQLENSLSIFKNKCNQFIFISSVAVYNRSIVNRSLTEDNSPMSNPIWDYSVNKVICERYLIEKCAEYAINYTIVRPSITYGNTRIPYGLVPAYGFHWTLIARIQNNKPIITWDGGTTVCTITHTLDFAKGVVGLLNNPEAYNEAFHIVGNGRYTWNEVLNTIAEIIGKEIIVADIPSDYISAKIPSIKGILLGDRAVNAKYDNSKIKIVVPEFFSDIDLRAGISQTIAFYKENNYLQGIDYKWDAEMDRLIYGYFKQTNRVRLKELNLKFINYLSDSYLDKAKYILNRYKMLVILILLIKFPKRAARKIIRTLYFLTKRIYSRSF
jgi:nucleoside-diphosphate-sugar epimerase